VLLPLNLVEGVRPEGRDVEGVLRIVEAVDELAAAEAGFQGRLDHKAEVVYRVLQPVYLLVQLHLLQGACPLEGLRDVLAEDCQLVDMRPF
jgi:hypothetical protein